MSRTRVLILRGPSIWPQLVHLSAYVLHMQINGPEDKSNVAFPVKKANTHTSTHWHAQPHEHVPFSEHHVDGRNCASVNQWVLLFTGFSYIPGITRLQPSTVSRISVVGSWKTHRNRNHMPLTETRLAKANSKLEWCYWYLFSSRDMPGVKRSMSTSTTHVWHENKKSTTETSNQHSHVFGAMQSHIDLHVPGSKLPFVPCVGGWPSTQ